MCFTIFQNEKTLFQAIKNRSSKSRKIAIFSTVFVQGIQARKMYFTMFQNERTPFQALKTRKRKNSKNCHFFKEVNSWFWSKNGHFFKLFVGGGEGAKQARKISFRTFQNEKTSFQAIKTKSLKSRKTAIFVKGLTHGFGPNIAIFPTSFFLGKIGQENVF